MLWTELETNPCSNIIHITYRGSEEIKVATSKQIYFELRKYEKIKIMHIYEHADLIIKVEFISGLVVPLQFLQHLANKYNVDIIGVAYEFNDGGYVESFELYNQMIPDVDEDKHVITFEPVNEDAEIETIDVLPLGQDDEILDDDCPKTIEDDDFELNCNTLLGDD